jgi:hypothetical protein
MGMEAETDVPHPLDHQGLLNRLDHADGDVSVAAQQILDGIGEHKLDDQLRMLLPQ